MAYTRNAIFLRWASGTKHRAFDVTQKNYIGGGYTRDETIGRDTNGDMRSVSGPNFRIWRGGIKSVRVASGTANDGTDDVDYGNYMDLRSAHAATDLEAMFHEDSEYIKVEWLGNLIAHMEFDPFLDLALIQAEFVQREL